MLISEAKIEAAGLGFEPRFAGPEPTVLPLDDPALRTNFNIFEGEFKAELKTQNDPFEAFGIFDTNFFTSACGPLANHFINFWKNITNLTLMTF